MKQYLTILILIFLISDSPKSQETIKDWQLGPDEETLEPGVKYSRSKDIEQEFIMYNLDPRDIAKKHVRPFVGLLKKVIKEKDFDKLVYLTLGVQSEIGKKMGGLESIISDDLHQIDENWKKIFRKTGKDPYCNYEKLLTTVVKEILIVPYSAKKPRPSSINERTNFNVEYLITINPNTINFHTLLVMVRFDNQTDEKWYYVTRYFKHCPIPNLVPDYNEHDYHLKP
ncbi:hypothetical protein EHQ16_13825 [Leptospira kanakyensis]|uniref:Uncharacterized protein n=1 Tax=Leptospira kanakyensis TaxID=2484968 RepID=A0A6N4QCT4_9LEPT|nr:hypothetical protein [Leptospira kanakyensis]TGK51646.1 hypothetical protein EHQ11_08630 [Leptospira kanakyensis]TGK58653.1 hypothetical protein EHQ16_13825 [Leptospira kanakyensis]TGK70856.1 hypothetical protein EHQ18_08695 [Leptospira kanakyensis]